MPENGEAQAEVRLPSHSDKNPNLVSEFAAHVHWKLTQYVASGGSKNFTLISFSIFNQLYIVSIIHILRQ